jgi:Domain of unknown function (DUF222)
VETAGRFDPAVLGKLGRHLQAALNPDGTLASDEDQSRRRSATLTTNRDGSGDMHAHLTPTTLAKVHDAIETAASMLLRTGDLPASGGTPATVLLTLTAEQLQSCTGPVTTGHG